MKQTYSAITYLKYFISYTKKIKIHKKNNKIFKIYIIKNLTTIIWVVFIFNFIIFKWHHFREVSNSINSSKANVVYGILFETRIILKIFFNGVK